VEAFADAARISVVFAWRGSRALNDIVEQGTELIEKVAKPTKTKKAG
jgi:hypothetical protein